jgi:glycosyltransferase involved in cell wall biosynthesis
MAKAAQIERETVTLSDCVVPVTEAARDEIRSRYPDQPLSKFQVVPNGFDPAAFDGFRSRAHDTGRILITYTGTVYAPADPAVFLDALDALPEALRARFEVRFIGRIAEEFDRRVLEGRKTRVKVMGFVPQKEAFRYLEESDYLLLPWADHLNVPGKLYEYIGTRKPVIAVVKPEADVVKVIQATGTGWCVDRSDPSALQALLMSLAAGDPATNLTPDEHAIRRFERPRLAREYGDLIQRFCTIGPRAEKEETVAMPC